MGTFAQDWLMVFVSHLMKPSQVAPTSVKRHKGPRISIDGGQLKNASSTYTHPNYQNLLRWGCPWKYRAKQADLVIGRDVKRVQ